MGEFVNIDVTGGGVATIRLDRPKVNALNRRMVLEIDAAVNEAHADDGVRSVVVWGGDRVFAAGADIKEMADLDPVRMFAYIQFFQDVFTRLEHLPKPTIAAINGYALGGGCELALACDLRFAAENAQLGQPEILLGVIPGAGGTQRLPRLVGVGRAKDIIFSGRFVDAGEAREIGLVNRVVPAELVYEEAVKTAEQLAAGPPIALGMAKQAIDRGIQGDIASGLLIERQSFAALFATEDQRIGMESFVQKGPGKAEFHGR
jgi:enoyl-CoA hydratase/carnithine racemase